MTHIEYDEFGAYEETIDLIPVGTGERNAGREKRCLNAVQNHQK